MIPLSDEIEVFEGAGHLLGPVCGKCTAILCILLEVRVGTSQDRRL